ncbi:zinc ribbon domain-containing protein [Candidatus Parcubacteria bacterium]|nr:zinc ribbon domain-containing protein [Candidatus Parcubacteria bacterium]
MKKFKRCQSCGMPFKKDPKGGGTNLDGSKNNMYCSYCFENGEFLQPNITLEEMEVLVKGKMKEMGMPGFIAKLLTTGTAKLERWKKKED